MDIRKLRNQLGLSQQALANETGISKAKIEKWETNKASPKVADFAVLQKFFFEKGIQDEDEMELSKSDLTSESQLASIMANIKMDYLVAIVAEIQEKVDSEKQASITVSKIQKLAQADFESKLNKLRSF